MNFYPVYRLCLSNGSFSRIGSLMETSRTRSARFAPYTLKQAVEQFKQKPGETILLGPRCTPAGKDVRKDEGV